MKFFFQRRPACFQGCLCIFCALALLCSPCCSTNTAAQTHVPKGKTDISLCILSADSIPMVSVQAISALTGKRTKTDTKGFFTLKGLPVNDTLVFLLDNQLVRSMPLSALTGRQNITIRTLDNVTVFSNGYTSYTNRTNTGSLDFMDNKLVNRAVGPYILDRLNGVSSGVYLDPAEGHPPVTIRGMATLTTDNRTGSASPLIVVDNFPYEGDIGNINPNDIENVTVLKDAAAASIWGAKAGNGVIVITTKKGVAGKLKTGVTANTTVTGRPDLYAQSTMRSTDFIAVEKMLFEQGFYDADINNATTFPVLSPAVALLNRHRLGNMSDAALSDSLAYLGTLDVRRDLSAYYYQKAVSQQYAVSLSGGNNTATYYSSIGYDKIGSNAAGDAKHRVTLRNGLNLRPVEKLRLAFSFQGTFSKNYNNNPGAVSTANGKSLYPYASLADKNGHPLAIERGYRSGFKDTAGGGLLLDWGYLPLNELDYADNTTSLTDILAGVNIKYHVLDGLDADFLYQFENAVTKGRNYYSTQTYFTRNLVNLYSQTAGSTVSRPLPLGGILDATNGQMQSHSFRLQLDYNKKWGQDWLVDALVGGELRQKHATDGQYRTYGYNDDNLSFVGVNWNTVYPTLDNLAGNQAIPNIQAFSDYTDRFISGYAKTVACYKGKYLLSASARKDGANILGHNTNDKWKPLWSLGTGWILSNERFWTPSWWSYLKIRGSYGYSGNMNNSISPYTTIVQNSIRSSTLSTLPSNSIYTVENDDLKWETVKTVDMGMDFTWLNGRVSGTLDWYLKNATDVISPVQADPTTGQVSLYKNAASLKGHGWDISLHSKNLTGPVQWNSHILFSYNRMLVKQYYFESQPTNMVGNGASVTPIIGKEPFAIISYKWGGLNAADGSPIGYLNGAQSMDYAQIVGNATQDDIVYNGAATPLYFGSFRNDVSFRHFTLSFNILYRFSYYFRRASINYYSLYNSWVSNADYEKRWQNPGDEKKTDVPSMDYPANSYRDRLYSFSSATVSRADHIRLQDIKLSYGATVRNKRFSSVPVSLDFYLMCNNVGILWRENKYRLDPDAGNGIPNPRSMTLGVNIHL